MVLTTHNRKSTILELVKLPPCAACTTLVNSFLSKSKDVTDFEYVKSVTCSGINRGLNQCRTNKKELSGYLKVNIRVPFNINYHKITTLCLFKRIGLIIEKNRI